MVEWTTTVATFGLTIDGLTSQKDLGWFQEVSGLSVDIEVKPVTEGGQNEFIHKLPGRMSWPNLVFKQGLVNSNLLFEWLRDSSGVGFSGKSNRLNRHAGKVAMYAADGTKLRAWAFTDAFPVKWVGPKFAASSDEVATEQLEIAHHGFTVG